MRRPGQAVHRELATRALIPQHLDLTIESVYVVVGQVQVCDKRVDGRGGQPPCIPKTIVIVRVGHLSGQVEFPLPGLDESKVIVVGHCSCCVILVSIVVPGHVEPSTLQIVAGRSFQLSPFGKPSPGRTTRESRCGLSALKTASGTSLLLPEGVRRTS
jgi:hypothetical protein